MFIYQYHKVIQQTRPIVYNNIVINGAQSKNYIKAFVSVQDA